MAIDTKEDMRIDYNRLKVDRDRYKEVGDEAVRIFLFTFLILYKKDQNERKIARKIRLNDSIPLK
jgi:hypothetical protein